MKKSAIAVLAAASVCLRALSGSISIADATFTYTQDFDTLPAADTGTFTWTDNSTLAGWYRRANVSNSVQTLDPDLTDLSAKGSNVGVAAFYNASVAGGSDRAIGFRVNGQPAGLKKGSMGMVLKNDTGLTLTGFDLGYTGEQWYKSTNETTLLFQYAIVNSFSTDISGDIDLAQAGMWNDVSALSWTMPASTSNTWTNGTDAANVASFAPLSISGLSIAPGQELVIRWRIAESGVGRAGLFVDDVTFGNLTTVPEPATYALIAGVFAVALVVGRRRRAS